MSNSRLYRLLAALQGHYKLITLSHNNPDPDAIASAWGIKKIVESTGNHSVALGYYGVLGRAENRALVRALGVPYVRCDEIINHSRLINNFIQKDQIHPECSEKQYDGLIVVDGQPGAGNITLPESIPLLAIIDHHPRYKKHNCPFSDIRKSFGTCTALVYEYFKAASLEPDTLTATIFYYAIRTETQDLGREANRHDRWLFRNLAHRVDWELLHRIAHAPVPRSYFATFKIALDRSRLYRDAVFADAGELPIPDAAAEIADWLLRLNEAKWALCCGTYRGRLLFSLRSVIIGAHCGAIASEIVSGWGTAGGHGSMAGGQVKLGKRGYERKSVVDELEKRYIKTMNYENIIPIEDPFAVVPGALSGRI